MAEYEGNIILVMVRSLFVSGTMDLSRENGPIQLVCPDS